MPYLSPEDLKAISEPDVRFGFDAPPFSLLLNHKQHLVLIGRRTPPGDQVYLQLVGVDGVVCRTRAPRRRRSVDRLFIDL